MVENKNIDNAAELLRELVSLKAYSGQEELRTDFLTDYFKQKGITGERIGNNLIFRQPDHDASKPTLMLNSHLDTVLPASGYSIDPFNPGKSDTHVYGLGSNDAGASVVSMIHTFLHFYNNPLPINLMLVLSTEEENSGPNGMRLLWEKLRPYVDMAIIGEPTGMRGAIAERGLLVIDGMAKGISGHAARNEGVNALYIALEDINTLRSVRFDRISPTMGEVHEKGWNEELQTFTQAYDNSDADSSLLLMYFYDFIDAGDDRFVKTVKYIRENLFHEGLMYRYKAEDDFGVPTSSFTICTFWLIDALYMIGEKEEARELFENMISYSNHLGLYSEDLDFDTKRQLGNFPQAYSHLAFINTAALFSEEKKLSKFIRP
jgi:hypothetical protein